MHLVCVCVCVCSFLHTGPTLAIQHFEVYVGSSTYPVIVYTDHNPLTFISRMRNQNQRLMRWFLIFQDYNLEIRYKKGTDNVVADALSRI